MHDQAPDQLDSSDTPALDRTPALNSVKPEFAAEPEAEHRWPAWYALVTAWLLPATTTRRMGHVSLFSAWCVHAAAWVLTVFVFIAMNSVMTMTVQSEKAFSFPAFASEFLVSCAKLLETVLSWPAEALIALGLFVLMVEVFYTALAFAALPYGAGVERFRDSLRHALRRAWLHTGHVCAACALAGFVTAVGAVVHQKWALEASVHFERSHPRPARPTDDANEAAMDAYWRANGQWNAARSRFVRDVAQQGLARDLTFPWYARHHETISVFAWLSAALWFLWALWRGVSAPRSGPAPLLEPLCRFCGYNLTSQSLDKRCPECGRDVRDSLAAAATPGAPWEQRVSLDWWRPYRSTALMALRRPVEFGRTLNLLTPKVHCLRFLVIHLVASAMIVAGGVTIYEYFMEDPYGYRQPSMSIGPAYGCLVVASQLAMVAVAALVAGLNIRARDGRNVTACVIQLACYGSGYLVIWALLSTSLAIGLNQWWDIMIQLEALTRISRHSLVLILWLAPNVLAAAAFIAVIYRGSAGVRYASR